MSRVTSWPRVVRRATWVALVLPLLLHATMGRAAAGEAQPLDDYVITSWSDEEGPFGGWIVGLAQDGHGYLWIGTVSGLIRFDGLSFERFHGTDTVHLPRRSVSAVYGAADGSVWVGFSGGGGIYRIQDQQIREYGAAEGLGEARTSGFTEDADGALLAATPEGLYRLGGDRWHLLDEASGLSDGQVFALYRDRASALWASTPSGVFRRRAPQERFEPVRYAGPTPMALSESARGEMWATHPSEVFAPLQPAPTAPPAAGRYGSGYRLLHDRAGNLWIATLGQGLWLVPGGHGTPRQIGAHNGLSNDVVRCLFEDRNGDVWVGTTVGLHRFARRRVMPVTGLGGVNAVEAAANGDVWIGTSSGLVRITGDLRRRYGIQDGLPSADIRGLHIDAAQRLWVSTRTGVATLAGERFTALPVDGERWPPGGAASLVLDASGDLWLCTEDYGLFRWRRGHLSSVTPAADASIAAVHSVAADGHGALWLMLGGGGLGRLDRAGAFSLIRSSDKYHRSDLAVHEDATGTLWFGAGDRLTRIKDGVLSALTTANGLPADAIRGLVTDRDGHLWVGTSGGIIRIDRHELDQAFADGSRRLEFRSYTSSDGLPGAPVRVGVPNAVRGADGRLWFVTGNGVTVIDPAQLSTTRPALPVRIERLTANGRSIHPTGIFTLPPRTTSLQIDYTALEFFSPRQVQFRYRLEGLTDEWTDAGDRRQALFTNLAPRDYRFRVMARSSEGVWSDHHGVIDFAIAPMFYQTRWFLALCTLAAVAAVGAGVRTRQRYVRRRFELILAERARMAREIHDTLLQSLAGLELQMDAMASQLESGVAPVKQQLARVRRQIQADVSEARQSIWDLRSPTLESRDLAAALRQTGESLAAANGVRFEFSATGVPPPVEARVEEQLLRVGKEALSNAMRHAHARVVRLELRYSPAAITLRVADDGRGFTVTETPSPSHPHWGLATMRERAAAIGGRLTLVSQPGTGTNLEMVAPLTPTRS